MGHCYSGSCNYCIWQRWGRKRTTQEQDQEKGDFNQVPQTDSQK